VLATLEIFEQHKKKEISLGELHESIRFAQEQRPLGCTFSDVVLYSPEISEALRRLADKGMVRRYAYREDSFLPTTFLAITPIGRSRSKKLLQKMASWLIRAMTDGVRAAISNYNDRWIYWSRPTRASVA